MLVRLAKALALLALAGSLMAVAMAWWIGGQLYAPANRPVGPPPADLGARPVAFPSSSGTIIKGWLVPISGQQVGVVLMHGSGGDRRSMISRARFLKAAGYAVLLFDFQATGESLGRHPTDGYLEAADAQAAVDFMRAEVGVRKVGAIGFSLGGAAAVLGNHPVTADALVLEAVYPTAEEAKADRIKLRLGPYAGWLYWLFTWQLEPRLGIRPDQLRPIDKIGAVKVPVFLIAGSEDPHPTLAESRRLFAAASAPKEFWAVPGAGHVNYHKYSPQEYETRVLDFFARTLLAEPAAGAARFSEPRAGLCWSARTGSISLGVARPPPDWPRASSSARRAPMITRSGGRGWRSACSSRSCADAARASASRSATSTSISNTFQHIRAPPMKRNKRVGLKRISFKLKRMRLRSRGAPH
jgi:uncharacterized protein